MDWVKQQLGGQITDLNPFGCAGVTVDGSALVAALVGGSATSREFEQLQLDSGGVIGVSGSDELYLTGRGPDGRVRLWMISEYLEPDDEGYVVELPLPLATEWAVPVIDAATNATLTAYRSPEGGWRLLACSVQKDDVRRQGRELQLGGSPDVSVAYSFAEDEPLWVVGDVGDGPNPGVAAWMMAAYGFDSDLDTDWVLVPLEPPPSALCSVSVSGGRAWIAGRIGERPVLYDGTKRVPAPETVLQSDVIAHDGKPVVIVQGVEADVPMSLLTASEDGNWLWWLVGDTWQRVAAPPGRLREATRIEGHIHVHVGGDIWSLPDPAQD